MVKPFDGVVPTPPVRTKLKQRLIEMGYGQHTELMQLADKGDYAELNQLRQALEAHALAQQEADAAKRNLQKVCQALGGKYKS